MPLVALAAVAVTVVPALVLAGRGVLTRLVALAVSSGVAAAMLHTAGADLAQAVSGAVPLLLIVGYSLIAIVVAASGAAQALADRVGPSPLAVFALAATLTLITSNDTVILVLAPVVLAAPHPSRGATALFVGANVSASLLPQASPTNLMVARGVDWSFGEYLVDAAPAGLTMVAVAAVLVFALLRTPSRRTPASSRMTARQRHVLIGAGLAVVAQPLAEMAGVPQAGLGIALGVAAVVAARQLNQPITAVLAGGAWLVLPVAAVMLAAGQILAASIPGGTGALVALLVLSAGATDLAAAATGAHLAASGVVPATGVLVAITTGAFVTPVGSLSGLLLIGQARQLGVRLEWGRVFGVASAIALACFVAGLYVVLR